MFEWGLTALQSTIQYNTFWQWPICVDDLPLHSTLCSITTQNKLKRYNAHGNGVDLSKTFGEYVVNENVLNDQMASMFKKNSMTATIHAPRFKCFLLRVAQFRRFTIQNLQQSEDCKNANGWEFTKSIFCRSFTNGKKKGCTEGSAKCYRSKLLENK